MKYKWPLNVNNFTFLDKLKICSFILNPRNRWTQGDQVKSFEDKFSKFVEKKYSVFVSSGSTANTLLAMYLKDKGDKKKTVVFPSTTWITSISPFLREGFDPKFIDVTLQDLSMNLDHLEKYLSKSASDVACVFFTSLLGFVPDIDRIERISKKYKVRIMMDNCENTLGSFEGKNVSNKFTSTTSTYFGHQLQSIEGGFVFTDSEDEYNYFLMARNHGMIRSLPDSKKYQNPLVDSRFDFNILGNNFRNNNLNAFVGQLDFDRVEEYIQSRLDIYDIFKSNLNNDKFTLPFDYGNRRHVPFSLPLICKTSDQKQKVMSYCDDKGIETRPIISGNLLRQTCLTGYDDYTKYEISELLNNNGFYVGLHSKLTKSQVTNFVKDINKC